MTDAGTVTHSIVIERVMPHSPEKVEHAGNYQGANYGRQKYFAGLERVAAGVP
jgi:hypothetical protein